MLVVKLLVWNLHSKLIRNGLPFFPTLILKRFFGVNLEYERFFYFEEEEV